MIDEKALRSVAERNVLLMRPNDAPGLEVCIEAEMKEIRPLLEAYASACLASLPKDGVERVFEAIAPYISDVCYAEGDEMDVARLALAAMPEQEVSGWQPIESAPKDERILAIDERERAELVWWGKCDGKYGWCYVYDDRDALLDAIYWMPILDLPTKAPAEEA